MGEYWQCRRSSALTACRPPNEMKHFGAAAASYGSVALFHMVGTTPEVQPLDDALPGATNCAHA